VTLVRHTSQDYPAKDRVAVMLEVYAAIERIDVDLLQDSPPETCSVVRTLPNLTILDAASRTECISRRTRRHVADGKDDLVFTIITGGQISYSRNGSEPEFLNPGDAYLGYNDRPSEHRLVKDPCFIDVVVPREVIGPTIADLDSVTKSKLPTTPELRLLTRYITSLTREFGELSADAAAVHSSHVRDLIALVVGAKPDVAEVAGRRGARATRLAAIKADIAANLTRPDLTIQSIAEGHGISPQYVRSLFNGEGTTFGDYLLDQRLAHAYRNLSDPSFGEHQISDIAFGAGFGDLSYFNRTFRRRYGMTPSDVREAAIVG
jgi:AraC-like DNA-binding protein